MSYTKVYNDGTLSEPGVAPTPELAAIAARMGKITEIGMETANEIKSRLNSIKRSPELAESGLRVDMKQEPPQSATEEIHRLLNIGENVNCILNDCLYHLKTIV